MLCSNPHKGRTTVCVKIFCCGYTKIHSALSIIYFWSFEEEQQNNETYMFELVTKKQWSFRRLFNAEVEDYGSQDTSAGREEQFEMKRCVILQNGHVVQWHGQWWYGIITSYDMRNSSFAVRFPVIAQLTDQLERNWCLKYTSHEDHNSPKQNL